MEKFYWDNSKSILNDGGTKILELYAEYLNSSAVVKPIIKKHVKERYHLHGAKILTWFDAEIPYESFEKNLKGLKAYVKNNVSQEKYQAAKEFVDNLLPEEEFVTSDDKMTKNIIIIRKKLGIKSTTVKEFFTIPSNMTEKNFFDYYATSIMWFMNHYLHKKIEDTLDIAGLKKENIVVSISPAIKERYINLYVDFEIDMSNLTDVAVEMVRYRILTLEKLFKEV